MKYDSQRIKSILGTSEKRDFFPNAKTGGDDTVCFVLMDGLRVKLAIYMQYEFMSTT